MPLSAAEFDVLTERARLVNVVADEIADIATDPTDRNVVYAASKYGGLWRSADGAQTWKLRALADEWITSVLVHPTIPTILYASVRSRGVIESLDSGATWRVINNGAFLQNTVYVAMQPGSPSTLFAGTMLGLFRTTDSGAHWIELTNGLVAHYAAAIAFDPSTPTTVYAARHGGGLYKSTNGGDSWSLANYSNFHPSQIVVDPVDSSIVYILLHNAGVMKSNDGGTSFVSLGPTSCEFPTGLAIDP